MQWKMPHNGYYYDLYRSPLAHVETIADVEKYPWPNALNPVRYEKMKEEADRIVYCKGMNTQKFKKEFGKDLTVWRGSCDTQSVLPYGTPQEVRDETKRRIEDLAPGGGFVFAPIHVIQNGVPPENIMAWWETLQEYNM